MSVLLDVLLATLVGAAWLGAAGFARLRTPLDRLHCVAFVNVGCGVSLLAASVCADGASVRAGKIAVVVVFGSLASAIGAHAIGRALRLRGSAVEAE